MDEWRVPHRPKMAPFTERRPETGGLCTDRARVVGLRFISLTTPRSMAEAGPSGYRSPSWSNADNRLEEDEESEPDLEQPTLEDKRLSMSFAGCGFLGIYHLGAASTFQKHGRGLLHEVQCFTGASAGALVASVLAIKGNDERVMQECITFTYNLAKSVHKHRLGLLTPGLSLLDSLRTFLQEELPEDAHLIANQRLYVSLTSSSSKKNLIVSEYDSKEDLIQCLLASSYVPHITGKKPVMRRGKKYIDGGMTDNLPIMTHGRTICVSPFSGRYEVCPTDKTGANFHVNINRQDFQVNYQNVVRGLHAFFPPKPALLEEYFHKGVRDATRFLMRENRFEPASEDSGSSQGDSVPNGKLPGAGCKSSGSKDLMDKCAGDTVDSPASHKSSSSVRASCSPVPNVQFETHV